jgi:hypothetical protein
MVTLTVKSRVAFAKRLLAVIRNVCTGSTEVNAPTILPVALSYERPVEVPKLTALAVAFLVTTWYSIGAPARASKVKAPGPANIPSGVAAVAGVAGDPLTSKVKDVLNASDGRPAPCPINIVPTVIIANVPLYSLCEHPTIFTTSP